MKKALKISFAILSAVILSLVLLTNIGNDGAVGANRDLVTEISPGAKVEWRTLCLRCGHYYVYCGAEKVIGFTLNELERRYRGWKVEAFSREFVQLSRELDCFCPEHFILRLKRDKLQILTVSEPELDEVALFEESALLYRFDDDEKDLLKDGVGFDSLKELDGFLEARLKASNE
ncbi:MAG: hypothetical protein K6G56_06760 [Clostridiales bacterium]|nr:hypothetical protein [Clostridiales bacterium]